MLLLPRGSVSRRCDQIPAFLLQLLLDGHRKSVSTQNAASELLIRVHKVRLPSEM